MDSSEMWSRLYSNKNGNGNIIVTDPKGEIVKLSEEEQSKLFEKLTGATDYKLGE